MLKTLKAAKRKNVKHEKEAEEENVNERRCKGPVQLLIFVLRVVCI